MRHFAYLTDAERARLFHVPPQAFTRDDDTDRLAVALGASLYSPATRPSLAKDLLRRQEADIAEVAESVGYGSASTFSTAFSRHVGQPPGRYARAAAH